MGSRLRRALGASVMGVAGLSASLAGCSKQVAPCLPPEAAAWIAAPAAAAPAAGPVDVYVDGSGSMAGFIRGATAAERPLQTLVTQMPWVAGSASQGRGATHYALFGRELHPLPAGQVDALATETPYACARCDNQETRLDRVLQAIGRLPADHLAVVVTDLWLSSAGAVENGPTALARPLSDMLQQGRSLGVLGVRAPYRGPIYDIPNAPPYQGATGHPLFVLLIGPVERVAAFRDRLLRPGAAAIRPDHTEWSLFSLTPAAPAAADAGGTLQVRPGPGLQARTVLPIREGLSLPQLRASLRASARASGEAGTAVFTARPESAMRPGAVWRGAMQPTTEVWFLASPGAVCRSARAWREMDPYRGGWEQSPEHGGAPTARFSLTAAGIADQLRPGHTYLVAGGLKRQGLTAPNPADAWMRQWSVDAASAPAVIASKPAFFPTLDLGRTAELMEDSLDQASAARGGRTPGFAVIVRADR